MISKLSLFIGTFCELQGEKMTAHDPMEKEMATEKKEERKAEAELRKQEAREENAAAKQAARAGGHTTYTTGAPGAAYGGATGHDPRV